MKTSKLYDDTISSLKICYDTHSNKFSSTRKKHRPEVEYIIKHLVDQGNNLTILELGCGDGRLYQAISDYDSHLITHYDGVDISYNLLDKAKSIEYNKEHKVQRHHTDMITYLNSVPDHSVNTIICMASFQHLPDLISRNIVLNHIYRILQYGGSFISIDRSWSRWMVKKHKSPIINSIKKTLQTFGQHERNNLSIPFTHHNVRHERLYHLFTRKELRRLLQAHGFVIKDQCYSSQDGSFRHNILKARNICTIATKEVFS